MNINFFEKGTKDKLKNKKLKSKKLKSKKLKSKKLKSKKIKSKKLGVRSFRSPTTTTRCWGLRIKRWRPR